jgi:ArsR family transcriptional regulator
MPQPLHVLLRGLRASAEPSRLRLLAVLAAGEFTVSELTQILGQSQPRVSRHLKLLSDDGLLERFREQHWVYHRVPAEGDGAELVRVLLGLLDRDDPLVALDRARAAEVLATRTAGAAGEPGLAQASAPGSSEHLAELAVAELGEGGFDTVLYLGREPAEMLRALAPRARRAVGISDSRPDVQRARASLHGRGLAQCVVQHGDFRNLAAGSSSCDAVVIDRLLARQAGPEPVLSEAARVLRPGGQLMIIEDYELLLERAAGSNPLGVLRDWIALGGLLCTRLRPVDVGAQHLLLATAAHERADAAA